MEKKFLNAQNEYRKLTERIESVLKAFNGNCTELFDKLMSIVKDTPRAYYYEGEWYESNEDDKEMCENAIKDILEEELITNGEARRSRLSVCSSNSYGYLILGDAYQRF